MLLKGFYRFVGYAFVTQTKQNVSGATAFYILLTAVLLGEGRTICLPLKKFDWKLLTRCLPFSHEYRQSGCVFICLCACACACACASACACARVLCVLAWIDACMTPHPYF